MDFSNTCMQTAGEMASTGSLPPPLKSAEVVRIHNAEDWKDFDNVVPRRGMSSRTAIILIVTVLSCLPVLTKSVIHVFTALCCHLSSKVTNL